MIANFPKNEDEARVCRHNNRYWFGHECGLCEDEGYAEQLTEVRLVEISLDRTPSLFPGCTVKVIEET